MATLSKSQISRHFCSKMCWLPQGNLTAVVSNPTLSVCLDPRNIFATLVFGIGNLCSGLSKKGGINFIFINVDDLRNLIFAVLHCRMVAKYIYLTILVEDVVRTQVRDR